MPEIDQLEVKSDLKLTIPIPANRHPATIYLSGLSAGSRPTMLHSLNPITSLLTNGEYDALTQEWGTFRYQHTTAVRETLRVRFALVAQVSVSSSKKANIQVDFWKISSVYPFST